MAITYRGFSTVNNVKPPYTLTDIELIKTDIMNHFNTKIGERVMMPEYGSYIHDIIMDPLDTLSKDQIREDVRRILSSDPRVSMQGSPNVTEYDNVVRVQVEVIYAGQTNPDHLYIEFERELREAN